MIRSAVRLGHQLLRGLSFVLIILVAAGAWAFGSLSVAQAATSPGISLASLPDNAASVSAYDYGDDFARPPPVPSDDERSSGLDAESGWVRRAFSGLEVLTYTPSAADDLARLPVGRRGSPMDVPRGTNAPGTIGGRQYGGHALDEMMSEGFTPSVVEDAIRFGQSTTGASGRVVYYSSAYNVTVIVENGRVVTVSSGQLKIR